jgi:hypothetical protein
MTSRKYQPSFDELVNKFIDEAFVTVKNRHKRPNWRMLCRPFLIRATSSTLA